MNMDDTWHLTHPKAVAKLPLERASQAAVMDWCAWMGKQYDDLLHVFAVPNGDKRSPVTAAMLKRQGVKPGVSDLLLCSPRGGFIGLAIEMKRKPNGMEPEQTAWQNWFRSKGWKAATCWSATEAQDMLLEYVQMPPTLYGQAFADSSVPF
jgi:hypothetical protein